MFVWGVLKRGVPELVRFCIGDLPMYTFMTPAHPYLVGTLVRRCRCATSWSDLDLTFNLAIVTLSLKFLSGLYLGNRKV